MTVHHGKKLTRAARTLAQNSSTKKAKKDASKVLNDHKKKCH